MGREFGTPAKTKKQNQQEIEMSDPGTVSSWTKLSKEDFDGADLLPVIDVSETGRNRNKTIRKDNLPYAPEDHTHNIVEIYGLDYLLDLKSPVNHTHPATAIQFGSIRAYRPRAVAAESRNLDSSDQGRKIWCNSSAPITLTVPVDTGNSAIDLVIDSEIDLIQIGTGEVWIAPEDLTVLINDQTNPIKLSGKFSGAQLVKYAPNTYYLLGGTA
jgi:hypothetical protein